MPRLIDADALEAYIKDYACIPCKEYGADKDGIRCDFCGFGFCLEGIKRHTAHDAEPVRCRDCKYYIADGCDECELMSAKSIIASINDKRWYSDFYCAWGEKEEDAYEEPEINPCRGCEDYDGEGGCLSNGGCGVKMDEVIDE